ncbi:retrovirus-related pol polyprotein LINE-1 [Tanacetum coccineum]|uniref:Retrovirus-related pol polyprotein LINE-1 n=1 Tax=Tanacetum coccineum TaxID=301880 RepID=A0ABQ4X2S1_9ASTR
MLNQDDETPNSLSTYDNVVESPMQSKKSNNMSPIQPSRPRVSSRLSFFQHTRDSTNSVLHVVPDDDQVGLSTSSNKPRRKGSNVARKTSGQASSQGKRLELADALERHRVDIACFQETKWKGSSNIDGNGYKLWYSGSLTARNGIRVILKACLKDKVIHVIRCSDKIITLTLVIDGEIVNVISAYAPQVGQRGDLNGHIGVATEGYAGVHGGFGYGVRNEEGRAILDFAIAHDLVVVNSHFKKRDHHLVTFQSGGGRGVPCRESYRRTSAGRTEASYLEYANAKDCPIGGLLGPSKTHTGPKGSLCWLCEEVQAYHGDTIKVHGYPTPSTFVAQAKEKAYKDLYKKLNSKDGANDIFRIAKARERRRRDLGDICFIKDEEGRTITDEKEIKKRWGEYFSSVFNARERGDTKRDFCSTALCMAFRLCRMVAFRILLAPFFAFCLPHACMLALRLCALRCCFRLVLPDMCLFLSFASCSCTFARTDFSLDTSYFGGGEYGDLEPEIIETLIQVFDESNDFVKVFTTTKDICIDKEPPEFKIRLYNSGNWMCYHAPNTGSLGAIVYDRAADAVRRVTTKGTGAFAAKYAKKTEALLLAYDGTIAATGCPNGIGVEGSSNGQRWQDAIGKAMGEG